MMKFALSLMVASAAVFGLSTAASAQYGSTTTTTTTVVRTTTTVAPTTTSAGSGANVPSTTIAPTTTTTTTAAAASSRAGLPATGSGGIGTTTGIAIGLLAVGLGLFIVTRVRRSQPSGG